MKQHQKIVATVCYVVENDKVLLIHRNKKENDAHEGKYNGLGGKSEPGESPHTCVIREMKEETGLDIIPTYRGNMTFGGFGKNGEDWEVHFFRVDSYSGDLIDCPEGTLEWHSIFAFVTGELPVWDSDKLFIKHIFEKEGVFIGQAQYGNGNYVSGSVQIYKL